ncbi:hypothetical protein Q5P01_018111 [Channa striata]|uniref:Uncharacterized protein n=1 Tax=Channa striata TaxID=64152 RepID=A0AA88S7R2_CHASR|nr:hypothetical protein Q5P01_018111 [Channa striata]
MYGGKPSSSWHFVLTDQALGRKQSPASPFLIASIQEDESGPSAAVKTQEWETQAGTALGGNHNPLVGLRAQPLKHTPREKYVEDEGQEAGLEGEREKEDDDEQKLCKEGKLFLCDI